MLCTFWLANVLRATTACNFSSLIWPAGSAPAALASLLFDPPEPHIIGKTQCFATFLPFHASASSFFLLFFLLIFLFSLPLPCSAFHLSILSEVWLLNFLRLSLYLMFLKPMIQYIFFFRSHDFFGFAWQVALALVASYWGHAGSRSSSAVGGGHFRNHDEHLVEKCVVKRGIPRILV